MMHAGQTLNSAAAPDEPLRRKGRRRTLAIALASTIALLGGGSATLLTLSSASASPAVSYPIAYPGDPNQGVLNQGTRTTNFDGSWKFKLVSTTGTTDSSGVYGNSSTTSGPNGLPPAAATTFDDSSWSSVTLPHDWSITIPPANVSSQPAANGYEPGGLGWYRKSFTLPASDAGKQIWIDFDGVFDNSFVYVNGTPAPVIGAPTTPIPGCNGSTCAAGALPGSHPYGYSTFSVDVTNLVHTDGTTPNEIAVVVQNLEPSSRWYSGSGITRHVHLTVLNPVHVARYGTFVTTPNLASTYTSSQTADVHVSTQLVNQSGADTNADVTYTVRDASGNVVATQTTSGVAVPATASNTAPVSSANDMTVSNPTLWSPSTPYLYTLQTDVKQGGNTVDSTTTTFGIRWIVVDPNDGVFVNGQHVKLQGVDLHQDEGALGSVNNYDALWREMSELKSEGVNAFRTSHNPPSPEMIDVCQRLGILMMVEAFDTWDVSGKVSQDYHLYYPVWHNYDIQDMVNEAKNSPAVLQWSIGNEIPSWSSTSTDPQATNLIADIKSIDITRPVVGGSDQYRSLPSGNSGDITKLNMLDGLGLNYNPALVVDQLHQGYPSKFFFESESSSETSSRGTYLNPELVNTGANQTPGRYNVSSYDNNMASWTMSDEFGLKKDRDRPFYAGEFIWSGFDYIGEPTPYAVFPVKSSFFGAIDTAGFPKDGYYAFKSQFTTTPMIHIVPMNWTDYTPGQTVQVWVDTNQAGAQLWLNGVNLGPPVAPFVHKTSQVTGNAPWLNSNTNTLDSTLYPSAPLTGPLALPTVPVASYYETNECSNDDKQYTQAKTGNANCVGSYQSPNNGFTEPNPTGSSGKIHLTWNVPFQPGKLVAVATSDTAGTTPVVDGGGHQLTDEEDTAGSASTLTLTPDKQVILDNGRNLSYFTINVVDANGVMVPDANNTINMSVTGAGSFAGADNGDEDDAEPYQVPVHQAFNGKLLLIVQGGTSAGPITVTASSDGLIPVTKTIYASAATSGRVGVQPVYLRVAQGSSPSLPATVTAVNADGSTSSLPVTWTQPIAPVGPSTGAFTINGTVSGGTAQAIITVYAVGSIQTVSTAVAVGTAPALPTTVKVVYNDGIDQYLPVSWSAVSPAQYAAPGQFAVAGTVSVPGFSGAYPAVANVRVTSSFTAGSNLAAAASTTKPSSDADYSGASNEVPANMLDTSATSLWANKYSEGSTNVLPTITNSNHRDWVQVNWPTTQYFSEIDPFFACAAPCTSPTTGYELPSSVTVTYWNGSAWVPVTNQQTTYGTASEGKSTITFDPIGTTKIRLWMIGGVDSGNDQGGALVAGSATTGNLGISQLQVPGNLVTLSSSASLSDLKVNGQTVPGFSPTTTGYHVNVPANQTPTITATAANNGSVVITPPLTIPGTATITVTSEDGSTSQTYSVLLDPAFAQTSPVATVPSTLAVSVGPTAPSFGVFTPGVAQTYSTSLGVTVTTTAASSTLTAQDTSSVFPGHLVNSSSGGPYGLASGLQVDAIDNASPASSTGSGVFWDLSATNPATLLTFTAPVSNDPVTAGFKQVIGATDPLRTGAYTKTITLTLSTSTP